MSNIKDMKSFDFGVSTHTGLVRHENEDYSAHFECINGDVFIVCDGMGGHPGGAVASQLAIESIRAYLENHYFDMPEDALKAAIEFANSVVYKKAKESPEYSGMGTTIVMAVIRFDKVFYAHVGDSRIYIFTENKLHKLTRDHSHVQNLTESGAITEQEAETHPARNLITRALGTSPNIEIDICSTPAIPAMDDIFMFCTDGLTNLLNDTEISDVLQESIPVQDKTAKLVQLSNDKGGTDNITVQLVHFNNVANRKSKFASLFQQANAPKPPVKDKEPKITKVEDGNQKENILKRIKFIEKLKEKPDLKQKIRIAVIVLGVLFLAFVVWDLFIRQSISTSISDMPNPKVDTVQKKAEDTVAKNVQLPAKPDTIWISYSVKKGEILGKISSKFGISVSFIKEKNKLKNDMIAEKQKLEIPTKTNHSVQANESLAAIAKKYQVDKNSILKANDIKDEKSIKAGRDLIIPFK